MEMVVVMARSGGGGEVVGWWWRLAVAVAAIDSDCVYCVVVVIAMPYCVVIVKQQMHYFQAISLCSMDIRMRFLIVCFCLYHNTASMTLAVFSFSDTRLLRAAHGAFHR